MHRTRVGFPIEVEISAVYSYLDIIGVNRQRAIIGSSFFRITPQIIIGLRDLFHPVDIARIQLHGVFQLGQGFFELAPPIVDQTYELENAAVVRQAFARQFKLTQRFVVIQIPTVKIRRAREVCLTSSGSETKRGVDRSLGQTETTRAVVVAEDVKQIMNSAELV